MTRRKQPEESLQAGYSRPRATGRSLGMEHHASQGVGVAGRQPAMGSNMR